MVRSDAVVVAMKKGFSEEDANAKERWRKIPVLADDQTSAPLTSVSVLIEDLLSRTDRPRSVSVLRYVEVLNSRSVASANLFPPYFRTSSKLTSLKLTFRMFVCMARRAEGLEVEHDVVGYTVLCVDNYVWKSILGQSLFQFHVTADCSTESVDACFEYDVRVSKIVPDHIDHCLVDVHEGTSGTPAAF
jgi:hypothetical protein